MTRREHRKPALSSKMRSSDRNSRHANSYYSAGHFNRGRRRSREDYNGSSSSAHLISGRSTEHRENRGHTLGRNEYNNGSRYSSYDGRRENNTGSRYSPYDRRREIQRHGQSYHSLRDEEYDPHLRDFSPISRNDSSENSYFTRRESRCNMALTEFSDEEHDRRHDMNNSRNLETEEIYRRTSIDRKDIRHEEYETQEMFHSYESQKVLSPNISTTEDAVSYLLNIVLQNGGEVPVSKLEDIYRAEMQGTVNTIKDFLKKFPEVFEFDHDTLITVDGDIVRAKTTVKLCEAHSNKPGSCNANCNSLHICKFFLLSSCDMDKCKFGHELYEAHNIQVQRKFYLHHLDLPHLRLLLRHDGNRCSVTTPIICRYYNDKKGCRSKGQTKQTQRCTFLHVCQNFVEGKCAGFCKLNHNFLQADVHEILCKYGLDLGPLWNGKERVLNMLRSSIASFQEKDIGRKYKGGYISARQGMKKTAITMDIDTMIQMVGENANIMEKLHRVINKSQNIETTNTMSTNPSEFSNRTEDIDMDSTDTDSTDDSRSNKIDSFNDTIAAGVSGGSGVGATQSWTLCDGGKREMISQTDMKIMEEKYQNYLQAKQVAITINNKSFEVDFENMEGWFSGSTKRISIERNAGDARSELELLGSKDEDEQKHVNNDKKNVSFENMKDADFIKIE